MIVVINTINACLVSVEGGVEDGDVSLDDGAVLEAVDVAGVDLLVVEVAHLGARPVARHALPVLVLLLWRARTHARARVLRGRFALCLNVFVTEIWVMRCHYLEEVLGAVLDAGCAVGVLSVGVLLPLVLDGVVALHGRALLLAHAVVVKVPAGQAVGLLGTRAPSRAEQVAALAGLGPEAPALVALRAEIHKNIDAVIIHEKILVSEKKGAFMKLQQEEV